MFRSSENIVISIDWTCSAVMSTKHKSIKAGKSRSYSQKTCKYLQKLKITETCYHTCLTTCKSCNELKGLVISVEPYIKIFFTTVKLI